MRALAAALSVAILAGCVTPPPETRDVQTKGVGFESYAEYQRRREQELITAENARRVAVPTPSAQVIARPIPQTAPYAAAPAAAAPLAQPQPVASAPLSALAPAATAPAAPAATANDAGISDEQEFSAVAARESIESDKARIAANKQQYQEIAPTAVPDRPGSTSVGIVEYALQATNRVGQPVYKRSSVSLASHTRACAGYASPDRAQEDFLKRGGPNRDPKNLDPDGDGFACSWDPTPFQKARGG